MFSDASQNDRPQLYLKPNETVYIPFKYQSFYQQSQSTNETVSHEIFCVGVSVDCWETLAVGSYCGLYNSKLLNAYQNKSVHVPFNSLNHSM